MEKSRDVTTKFTPQPPPPKKKDKKKQYLHVVHSQRKANTETWVICSILVTKYNFNFAEKISAGE